MFEKIFIEVLNMSYIGSMVIIAVLMARLLLKKAPKKYSYLLWSVVLLRLVIPFSFDSVLSLLPFNPKPIPVDLTYTQTPQIITGISAVDVPINNALPLPEVVSGINPLQMLIAISFFIWIIGMSALLIYGVSSYIRMKHHLRGATMEKDNLFISSKVLTPFVLGLVKPKIYLPVNLDEAEKKHIVLHEQTHVRRFDHVIRFVSYVILCIHWFNPLVWAAFYVSGKDMEMACDESVLNQLGYDIKKDYSQSLLKLSTDKRNLRMSPLAFGEGDTKGRIKNILNLKKPKVYVIAAAGVILAVIMVGLITNSSDQSVLLTEKEIVDTFAAHDLALAKGSSKNPADYAVGGIEPAIFRFKDYEGTLYLYVFDSLDEKNEKIKPWQWQFGASDDSEFDGAVSTNNSKNAAIVLEAPFGNGDILEANEYSEFGKLATSIADTVFQYLNDGKTVVFSGESAHWRGTDTLKYYNNPITDENGKLYMDTYGWAICQIAYIGDDPENVGMISYKYDRAGSGGEGTGLRLNDEGIFNIGGGSGSGFSSPTQEVTVNVTWNGQEESFVLQP